MRRVRRPKEQEEFYQMLVNKEEFGIFQSFKDVFMLAGMVGYFYNRKKSFEGSAEPISWDIFKLETDELVMNLVAINETEDLKIIEQENFNEKLTIFEEYAAGGIERLVQLYNESPAQFTDTLYEFLIEMEEIQNVEERELIDITRIL